MSEQEQANHLSSSLFRQLFLIKMLHYEYEMFSAFNPPSKIKQILHRAKHIYPNTLTDLKIALPNSKETIDNQMKVSDEKIRAMSTIFEKLSFCSEEEVLNFESQFEEMIKVKYA